MQYDAAGLFNAHVKAILRSSYSLFFGLHEAPCLFREQHGLYEDRPLAHKKTSGIFHVPGGLPTGFLQPLKGLYEDRFPGKK